jgi:RNA polymerase sigma factor (sigma-70 family)
MRETHKSRIYGGGGFRAVTHNAKDSFARFYAAHVRSVRRFVSRLLPGSSEVEEVTHQAFANVFQAHQEGRDVANRGYVFATARNLVNNIHRRNIVRQEVQADPDSVEQRASDEPDAERQLLSRERLALLRLAFAQLSPLQQEIILLRKLDNLRIKEIADRKGLSVSLVEKQIRYGLRACQSYLDAQDDESHIYHAMQNKENQSRG